MATRFIGETNILKAKTAQALHTWWGRSSTLFNLSTTLSAPTTACCWTTPIPFLQMTIHDIIIYQQITHWLFKVDTLQWLQNSSCMDNNQICVHFLILFSSPWPRLLQYLCRIQPGGGVFGIRLTPSFWDSAVIDPILSLLSGISRVCGDATFTESYTPQVVRQLQGRSDGHDV